METRTQIPSNTRALLSGSATIGTMLLVSGSTKVARSLRGAFRCHRETAILSQCGAAHTFAAALPPNVHRKPSLRAGGVGASREKIMDARYYVVRDHDGWMIKFEDEHY